MIAPRTVFAKVVAIMLAMAICLLTIVTLFFGMVVGPNINESFDRMLAAYAKAFAATSPTRADADRIVSDLHVNVRYEGAGGSWTTDPRLPSVAEFRAWSTTGGGGFLPRRQYQLAASPSGGTYLFAWSVGGHMLEAHEAMLVALILLMAGVILAANIVLRRLLDPLRALNTAVGELGAGRLDTRVPIRASDEFGRLTAAFNQMAERVSEMVQSRDRLLTHVSHELRSPLTRMKVALELPSGDVQRDRLAEDAAEMEHVVSELLELERLRTGRAVALRDVELVALLRDVASRVRDRAPGVRVIPTDEEIWLQVDDDQVRTALRNLVENALKYSLPDSRPVELRVARTANGVAIRVVDDGIGVSAADAERIFEPFYRVDPSRSKRTGGYGLGLSICKRIMEAHGGTITVERLSPRGTAFVLTFPHAGAGFR